MNDKLKNINIDKAIKLAVIAGILLVIVFVFYYYVFFLPQEKKQVIQALDACIADAYTVYNSEWQTKCKVTGKLTSRCASLLDRDFFMTFNEYIEQNDIPRGEISGALPDYTKAALDFYNERNECSCSLPPYLSERLNQKLQQNNDFCFKRYPQR